MSNFRLWLPNALSISRIPAALLFLVVFSPADFGRYAAAAGIAIFALLTDVLDGQLSRRWNVTSDIGYFLDGLGDKVFYIAILILMIREGATSNVLAWLLIIREIALYAMRTIDRTMIQNLRKFRTYSRAYALFIRLYFGCFFIVVGAGIFGADISLLSRCGEVFGYIAGATGGYAIFLLARDIAQRA